MDGRNKRNFYFSIFASQNIQARYQPQVCSDSTQRPHFKALRSKTKRKTFMETINATPFQKQRWVGNPVDALKCGHCVELLRKGCPRPAHRLSQDLLTGNKSCVYFVHPWYLFFLEMAPSGLVPARRLFLLLFCQGVPSSWCYFYH